MKKLLYISVFFALAILPNAMAQHIGNLNGIYYQAVAVDEIGKEIVGMDITGKPLYNKAIGVRFTINKGLNGTIQWEETHTTTTDKYGLFTLIIGKGTPTGNGKYARLLDIPWIDADQFLKVEIAIKNDGNYKLVSNQQFMSVPYSFYTDDIADDAITTFKILDSAILNQDIHTSAVDSRTILDSAILNQDIRTGAVDSRTILNETILAEDINTGAVTTSELLDSTILNQDIHTGAVDSRTILAESILAEDINTGAVTTSEILDSTIINKDIQTNAIDSRAILNGSILNADIADTTIDLTSKVNGVLPVAHGGTGTTAYLANSLLLGNDIGPIQALGQATDGQVPVGVTGASPKLKVISAGSGINVSITADSIIISSGISGIFSTIAGTISPGLVIYRTTWVSPPIPLAGVNLGNIIVGSIKTELFGCQMTTYVMDTDMIQVSIYNGTGNTVDLGTDQPLKVLVVK